jgi:hypothetical protein
MGIEDDTDYLLKVRFRKCDSVVRLHFATHVVFSALVIGFCVFLQERQLGKVFSGYIHQWSGGFRTW